MRGSRTRRRGAVQAVELLFVLPVVLVLLAGLFELGMLSAGRQRVVAAAREGARTAAAGGDADAVERAVRRALGDGLGRHADVAAVLTDPAGDPVPAGEPVAVAVRVPARVAAPDLLRGFGLGLGDRVVEAEAVMRKE